MEEQKKTSFFDKLPFRKILENIVPEETRAKNALVGILVQYSNQIIVLILAALIANAVLGGGGGGIANTTWTRTVGAIDHIYSFGRNDFTYNLRPHAGGNLSVSGTYRISGNSITLIWEGGEEVVYTLRGSTIVDDEGRILTRTR